MKWQNSLHASLFEVLHSLLEQELYGWSYHVPSLFYCLLWCEIFHVVAFIEKTNVKSKYDYVLVKHIQYRKKESKIYLIISSCLNLISISLLGGNLGRPDGSHAYGSVLKNCSLTRYPKNQDYKIFNHKDLQIRIINIPFLAILKQITLVILHKFSPNISENNLVYSSCSEIEHKA